MNKKNLLIVCLLIFSQYSVAQETPKKPSASPKKIKIDFGNDELIKGDYERPEFDLVNTRTEPTFKKMIKVRDKFVDEVEKTREDFNAK